MDTAILQTSVLAVKENSNLLMATFGNIRRLANGKATNDCYGT